MSRHNNEVVFLKPEVRMSLADSPHYELPSTELAAWIEQQGDDTWWCVDGDPDLTSLIPMPCRGEDLARELRHLNRLLLVQATPVAPDAAGQLIARDRLDMLVVRRGAGIHLKGPHRPWMDNRELYLCWKGSAEEWLLCEDRETTEAERAEAVLQQGS